MSEGSVNAKFMPLIVSFASSCLITLVALILFSPLSQFFLFMPSLLGGAVLAVITFLVQRAAMSALAVLGIPLGWILGAVGASLVAPEGVSAIGRHMVFSVPLPAMGLVVSMILVLTASRPRRLVRAIEGQKPSGEAQAGAPSSTAVETQSAKPQEQAPEQPVQQSKTVDQPQMTSKIQEIPDVPPTVITLSNVELTLVEWMVEYGKTVRPLRDHQAPFGGRYPEAEESLGMDSKSLLELLMSLWRKGVLEGDFAFKTLSCPKCGSTDAFHELVCAFCKSEDIERQEVIQCTNCGYLGPLLSFTKLAYYECPQCRIRTEDIRSQGTREGGVAGRQQGAVFVLYSTLFRCNSCGSVSEIPRTELTCKSCGHQYDTQSGKYQRFYNFRLKPEYREYLEKEKKPLMMLYDLLRGAGLSVEAPSVLLDSAKTPHVVELLVKEGDRPLAAFLSYGAPYRSAGEVLSEAVWLRLEKELKEVYVLAVVKWPAAIETIAKSFGIELVDVSASDEVRLRQILSSLVSGLISRTSRPT